MNPLPRKPLDTLATSAMLILCLCWGFQQVLIKLVAADISPVMQIALRSCAAALVLGVLVWRREGSRVFSDGTLKPGLLVGSLFALEFLFVAESLTYTSASHVSVFLYTAPIFAALGLHLSLREERLKPLQWLGVLVAFGGIIIAFLDHSSPGAGSNMLLGDALALGGGLAWGATTVAIRNSSLSEASAAKTLFYQMLVAAVGLMAYAIQSGNATIHATRPALLSVAFQALVVALSSYLVWFWLLKRYLASRLSVLSFITPIFGVSFGVLILNEPLEASFLIGALLVLLGITLVSAAELLLEPLRRRRR